MSFEVGKIYKTRDGNLRQVIYIKPKGGLVVICPNADNPEPACRWENGQIFFHGSHDLDLVEEYTPPVIKKKRMSICKAVNTGNLLWSSEVPFSSNSTYVHEAIIELTSTDGVLTSIEIVKE